MSLPAPARRVASGSLLRATLPIRQRAASLTRGLTQSQHRRAPPPKESPGPHKEPSNPILDAFRAQNKDEMTVEQRQRFSEMQQRENMRKRGDLSSTSVFEDETRVQQQTEAAAEKQRGGMTKEAREKKKKQEAAVKGGGATKNPQNLQQVLDPDPQGRVRWERRKVIQMVRHRGRLTKAAVLKRTEREHLVKSEEFKTSVKKLGMLARQIAGKPIDEAITQMRFSKKKVAQEVLKQLEYARDEAIVTRGMGLGKVKEEDEWEEEEGNEAEHSSNGKPVQIRLKNGKRHTVEDDTRIYIDQAWVGRAKYGKLPDYRARGRVYILRTPFTSISVLLKEEKTRMREFREREDKRKKQREKKVWVHLPDRPIQPKHQWYSW